jgi:hypothetical protein
LATGKSRAPSRCGTRFADSTQLLTLVVGAASFVLVEKSRPAWMGGASRCYGGSSSRMGGGVACSGRWVFGLLVGLAAGGGRAVSPLVKKL